MIAMTTRDPEQTRQTILEAAFDEIHEHGFQAASLDRILSKTNLTKGALYHHFPSKHALGLAVVDEVIAKEVLEWRIEALNQYDDPLEGIIAAAREEVASLTEQELERGCPLNNLIQEMSPLDADFHMHLLRIVQSWQGAVAGALEHGRQNGTVRNDVDCEGAAWFILAAYVGCIGLSKVVEKDTYLPAIFEQTLRYFSALKP